MFIDYDRLDNILLVLKMYECIYTQHCKSVMRNKLYCIVLYWFWNIKNWNIKNFKLQSVLKGNTHAAGFYA